MKTQLNRRDFLKLGLYGVVAAGTTAAIRSNGKNQHTMPPVQEMEHGGGIIPGTGDVDHKKNGFDPGDILTDFDYGKVSTLPDGRILREYEITVINKNIEVVPGIEYPAWTYNGRIPGPTIRCTEGDRIRITFINGSNHPHTMHFHGFHPGKMDGVPGTGPGGHVEPGDQFHL